MVQVARNMTDTADGTLLGKRYLILDRDTKYSASFHKLIKGSGTKVIRLPPRSPNLNAYAERFVRSIKAECLDRMIFVGQGSLRNAVREYGAHYHGERNHQGLENRLLKPIDQVRGPNGIIKKRERLGSMLSYYYRLAA
jgi:putative transposase